MGPDLILFILGQVGLMFLAIFLLGVVIAAILSIWLVFWESLGGL